MTDAERIKRLENAVERLCTILKTWMYLPPDSSKYYPAVHADLELIKQWVRGDLEPK